MSDRSHGHEDAASKPIELPETETGAPDTSSSEQIDHYRLLDKLGEGGMGEVWLAEQQEPVKRKVALKLIKQGMDTKQVVARFAAEKQALALMEHPAIAKVYDAGATPSGRPYFAMEHVQGVPITEHCDRHTLTNRERLDLFVQVCDGVQHAHQKAVIHRDLKPSNVLISIQNDKPVPKIIDFGVAKAMAQKLTEQTLHTQLGVMIGTPAYMSPEQAEMTGQDIDTRTDVYALGVMLYELLVGALPFDMKELQRAGFETMVRKIREDEPPKPSTRLSTLGEQSTQSAKHRRTELSALKRELSGDLDWITLKALEKDRTRRYSSPQDLAADIERYLTNRLVLASPPSAVYRAKKFVKRHTWGVAVAGIGVLTLVAFAGTMAVQAMRIAVERDLAQQAQADLEKVVEFQAGMLSATDPEEMGRRLMENLSERVAELHRGGGSSEEQVATVATSLDALIRGINSTDLALDLVDEDILAAAVLTLEEKFADLPVIDAQLRGTIGETYRKLGRFERAEPQLEKALKTRKRVLGNDHPDTLNSMNALASLHWSLGRYDEAETLFVETVEGQKRILGDDHPDTLSSKDGLALVYDWQRRYDEAETLYLATLEAKRGVLGNDHLSTLSSMNNLANLYEKQGRYDEAEPLYIETLETERRVLGNDHLETLLCMNNLATLYNRQGLYDKSEPLYIETLEAKKRVLGNDHLHTLRSVNGLAMLYRNQGLHDKAELLFRENLQSQRRVLGDFHMETLTSMYNLANLYEKQDRYDEVEALYLETLEKRLLGDDHPKTLHLLNNLAELYRRQGRHAEAEKLHLKTLRTRKRVLGDDHPDTLASTNNLGEVYRDLGRYDEAEPLYLETLETVKRVFGENHQRTGITVHNLACLYREQERHVMAQRLFEQAQRIWESDLGPDHPYVAENLAQWSRLLRKTGDDAGADRMEARAKAIRGE